MTEASPVQKQRKKADRAWQNDTGWSKIYRDAYDFAIPNRKPGGMGKTKQPANQLFDMTAPTSAMNMAGSLQRLLFSNAPTLSPGALVKQAFATQGRAGAAAVVQLERALERTGEFMYPFMEAGDLDTSTHEMCIDLGVGTGVMIPMKGTPDQPIIFFTPPQDECAFLGDAYGRINFMSWKRTTTREAVRDAFPQGKFSTEFLEAAKQSPDASIDLYQDFYKREDNGGWGFCAYLDRDCDTWIASESYRTKPFVSPRYYRVAGEMRGRGPILLALPTIKAVNKAQELALKAAAIQMLGIWGYRTGSGFNPDTVNFQPGMFMAVKSTGGVQGPDIQRLDPAAGRLDVASMMIEGSQQMVRDALMDTRLQPETGTPRSASEIAARLRQGSQVHLGGFMRLWREVHPEMVPRCAEILNGFGYLGGLMDFNQLIVSVGVRSPMVAAMSADKVSNIAHYAELMTAMTGDPTKLPEYLNVDDAADEISEGLLLDKKLIPTPAERQAFRLEMQKQRQQAQQAEMATKAAPQVAAGAMRMIEGEAQPQQAAA